MYRGVDQCISADWCFALVRPVVLYCGVDCSVCYSRIEWCVRVYMCVCVRVYMCVCVCVWCVSAVLLLYLTWMRAAGSCGWCRPTLTLGHMSPLCANHILTTSFEAMAYFYRTKCLMPTPSLSKVKCIDQGNIWESIRKSMAFAQPTE